MTRPRTHAHARTHTHTRAPSHPPCHAVSAGPHAHPHSPSRHMSWAGGPLPTSGALGSSSTSGSSIHVKRLQHIARGPMGAQIFMGLCDVTDQLVIIKVCLLSCSEDHHSQSR